MLNEQVSQYIPSSLTDARQTSAALFASWARMFGKIGHREAALLTTYRFP